MEFIWGELSDCAVDHIQGSIFREKMDSKSVRFRLWFHSNNPRAFVFNWIRPLYFYYVAAIATFFCIYIPTHPPRAAAAAYSAWLGKAHPPKKKWEIEFTKCLFLYNVSLTKNSVKISIRPPIKGEKRFANEYMWVVGEILLSWLRRIHQKTIIRVVLENMTY